MVRTARSLTILLVMVMAASMTSLVQPESSASVIAPPSCKPSQVSLSSSSGQPLYTRGSLVHISVALHNHSAVGCSFDTGPLSPDVVLSNSAGVTVWGSCWFDGGPAPCAYYLRQNILAPGATYRDQLTWDGRTGHPDLLAPVGRYTLTANLQGLLLVTTTTFDIIRTRSLTVTVGDVGRHYALAVGDFLIV